MRRSTTILSLVLLTLALITQSTHAQGCKRVRSLAVDPVELIRHGMETKGDEKNAVTRGMYNYHFVSPENKTEFEKNPHLYEVQLGGACARMGPLSGYGRGDIFGVHNKQIYLFASTQCRESFLKAPEKLLETDAAPPAFTAEQKKQGMALIELAAKHAGGKALDNLKTFRQSNTHTETHGGKDYQVGDALTLSFPDSVRYEDSWDTWTGGQVVVADRGWGVDSKATEDMPLAHTQVRAVKRIANRHPVTMLRARKRSDFVAGTVDAKATGKDATDKTEAVEVYFDGCRSTWLIDAGTGRLISQKTKMRGPTLAVVNATITYLDERTEAGLTLPTGVAYAFEGDKESAKPKTYTLEIDPKLDAKLFVEPKPVEE